MTRGGGCCSLLLCSALLGPSTICCIAEMISADLELAVWHSPCLGSAEGKTGMRRSVLGTRRVPTCRGSAVAPAHSICVQENPQAEPQQVSSPATAMKRKTSSLRQKKQQRFNNSAFLQTEALNGK